MSKSKSKLVQAKFSDDQVNQFLGEKEGFRVQETAAGGKWCLWHPGGYRLGRGSLSLPEWAWRSQGPNYCHDYNALFRMVALLNDLQRMEFTQLVFDREFVSDLKKLTTRFITKNDSEKEAAISLCAIIACSFALPCPKCAHSLAKVLGIEHWHPYP